MADLSWDTLTMADLFAKQGHLRRAVAILRKLARDNPQDDNIRARLNTLESQLAKEPGGRMSFRDHLQRIVDQTPGAIASMIMGFDGIAIDSYEVGGGEIDIPTLLIEYSAAATALRRAATEVGSVPGTLVEMQVTGTKLTALLRPLTEEYFLAVVLRPPALTGKARYLMRVASGVITQELS